jgi:hypothetical protein
MQWFRANLKVGARLGLFALTLQIVLSFGHVHLGDLRHSTDRLSVAGKQSVPSDPLRQPISDSTDRLSVAGKQSVPSDPLRQPISDADEYCAICATIHLAATSLLPQAPQLSVPFAVQLVEHANLIPSTSLSPRRAAFQSRAPPLA